MHPKIQFPTGNPLSDIIGDYTASSQIIKPAVKKDLKVLSLFTGAGGMDIGFEGDFICHERSIAPNLPWIASSLNDNWVKVLPTRFQIIFANDILEGARKSWCQYMNRYILREDIYQLESIVDLVKQHQRGEKVFPDQVDVVIGGFPCQDFSVAGKRKGFTSNRGHDGKLHSPIDLPTEETRGMLYYWMREVISITKPKIFIAENVKGLVNFKDVKDIIQLDFARSDGDGYIVLPPRVLHAGAYGVPESRERVFFVGIRRSDLTPQALCALEQEETPLLYDPYPSPTHGSPCHSGLPLEPFVTCQEIFANLKEPNVSSDLSQQIYSRAKYMGSHCQGQKEIDLRGLAPTIRSEHHGNIEYRRLSVEHGGSYLEELELGLEERRLTPRECALIQTFPPDYPFVSRASSPRRKFDVSSSMAYKVIGNAVPPVLAYHIAQRLQELWDVYFKK
ncbi:DNA cytosine methyltransferase [uncultured Porphyromonas sp.]|jgi:DNA (cytosine-5-)-methyltransferase|uniref:DNA cytosine methyltransferase n=1 Tax=uncultured Porphyromonas sp. TaxID=159274 RepID=UPI0026138C89|nr:DNA (cytosine-5-)-methyltransferase [uncultured Porphyromonas sp.]